MQKYDAAYKYIKMISLGVLLYKSYFEIPRIKFETISHYDICILSYVIFLRDFRPMSPYE